VVISHAVKNHLFPGVSGDEQLSTRGIVHGDGKRHRTSPHLWLHMNIESCEQYAPTSTLTCSARRLNVSTFKDAVLERNLGVRIWVCGSGHFLVHGLLGLPGEASVEAVAVEKMSGGGGLKTFPCEEQKFRNSTAVSSPNI
jgi:hypothetical protein